VYVVRAFIKLRRLVATHKELARKLAELEQRVDTHDHSIRQLIEAIRQLMSPPPDPKRRGKDRSSANRRWKNLNQCRVWETVIPSPLRRRVGDKHASQPVAADAVSRASR
jgi:hypothetical protein